MPDPADALRQLADDGLLRSLRHLDSGSGPQIRRDDRLLWNFAGNDYLGLARHPLVETAFLEGIGTFGAGSTASRLVSGSMPPHRRLEEKLAAAKHTEAALTFTSGFATALGAIPAIVGKEDFVILDKLCHACLVDGARLSGATIRVFPHNDVSKLAKLLSGIRAKNTSSRILVLTESVFSMDGDLCPLEEILTLTETHGADLFLDEAHGIGVLGPHGMGLAEALGVQSRVTFQMGTLSKAAGLSGGYLAASRPWIDLLINRARSFIFTTAPPPALAHAAITAIELIQSREGDNLRRKLRENITTFGHSTSPTAIQPVILGSNQAAISASSHLESNGYLVPAIRFPTVPRGSARLRVSLSAAHPPETVATLRHEIFSCHST